MPTDEQKQKIRDNLIQMNRKMAALIAEWDDLSWGDIGKRIKDIESLKDQIIEMLDYQFYKFLFYTDLWLFLAAIRPFSGLLYRSKFQSPLRGSFALPSVSQGLRPGLLSIAPAGLNCTAIH